MRSHRSPSLRRRRAVARCEDGLNVRTFPRASFTLGTNSAIPGAPVLPAPIEGSSLGRPSPALFSLRWPSARWPGADGTWRSAGSDDNGATASSKNFTSRASKPRSRRLTLDPVRGLIAQDVRIFDFKNRENTLAVISEIALDINYAALLHHQPFLNALDVHGAELTIPTQLCGKQGTESADHPIPRAYLFPAGADLCQPGGRNVLRPANFGDRSTDQTQRLQAFQRSLRGRAESTDDAHPTRRGRAAPIQFSRRSAIAAGEIFRRSLPLRNRPRGSDFARRAIAARILRNEEPCRRRGVDESNAQHHPLRMDGSTREVFPAGRAGVAKRKRRIFKRGARWTQSNSSRRSASGKC